MAIPDLHVPEACHLGALHFLGPELPPESQTDYCVSIWMFPNCTPKSDDLGFLHYKPSILGYPYFWEHPYVSTTGYLLIWGPVLWILGLPLRIPIPFIKGSEISKPPTQTNN